MTARYFMFSQVYYHDVRLIYDQHLIRYLRRALPGVVYPVDVDDYLSWDDVRVMALLKESRNDPDAGAILNRQHFRTAYHFTPAELASRLDFADLMESRLRGEFGDRVVVVDSRKTTRSLSVSQILVVDPDLGQTEDIMSVSNTLSAFQPIWFVRAYAPLELRTDVRIMVKTVLAENNPLAAEEPRG